MTKAEFKNMCKKANISKEVSQAFMERYDLEKITKAVERSSSKKNAMKAINAMYPEIEIKEMQKMLDFYESQFKGAVAKPAVKNTAPMELTMEELSYVAGGSGSWWNKNWLKFLVGIAVGIGVAILTGVTMGAAGAILGAVAGLSAGVGAFQGLYNVLPEQRSKLDDGTDKWRENLK